MYNIAVYYNMMSRPKNVTNIEILFGTIERLNRYSSIEIKCHTIVYFIGIYNIQF